MPPPANHVRCPECHKTRVVTERQARRVRAGQTTGLCMTCRGHGHASDTHLRFWLNAYGAPAPRGSNVRAHIAASGLPPELSGLASAIFD